jgi:hypothetical protein
VSSDGVLDVVEVDAKTFSFDHKLLEFVLKEISFFGFGRSWELGDNSRRTRTDLEKARVDKTGDDFVRRVGIDLEFAAEDTDRRKIVAWTELARDDGLCRGVHDLLVERRAGSEVDVEGDHLVCTMTGNTAWSQGGIGSHKFS